MADTLSMDVQAKLSWVFLDGLGLSTIRDESAVEYKQGLSDGTALSEADKIWHDQRTLSSAASETLDLSALTQTLFGSTVTIDLAKVKCIFVKNNSINTGGELLIGDAASNAFEAPFANTAGGLVEVGPNSPLLLANLLDGWSVGSDVNLKIANTGSADITYDIVIVGTSV